MPVVFMKLRREEAVRGSVMGSLQHAGRSWGQEYSGSGSNRARLSVRLTIRTNVLCRPCAVQQLLSITPESGVR